MAGQAAGRSSVTPQRRPTIRDVARLSGVSPTTVSHALSGHGRVAATTRRRVEQAASRLGYRANPAARHLRGGRTGTVGLVLPQGAGALSYYLDLALGAARRALAAGLALTLLPDLGVPSEVAAFGLDVVAVVDPVREDPLVAELARLGVPVVTGERQLAAGSDAGPAVETDHREALAALLDHLLASGARTVALVSPPPDGAFVADTLAGYEAWCRRHGVEPRVAEVPFIGRPEQAEGAVGALLGSPSPPDAVVGVPEHSALGVAAVASRLGLAVPGDLLVASCVDSPAHAMAWPPITALDLRPGLVGARLVDALAALLAGEAPVAEPVEARLVVRASTLRPPAG